MLFRSYAHAMYPVHQPVCGILFVSRTEPVALLKLHERSETERGWDMFKALLDYWYAQTGLAR